MSKEFCEKMGKTGLITRTEGMRKHCQRPGRHFEDGTISYTTEQAHKNETDINQILRKYDKTGLITHISKFEGSYGDHTGLEYKEALDLVINAQHSFEQLPATIKKYFGQSPENLLRFMEDENNRDEAIKLGLIDPKWTLETDGLGEHVLFGENKNVEPTPPKEESE